MGGVIKSNLLEHDKERVRVWKKDSADIMSLLGLDEAGTGSLVGSFFISGVVFPSWEELPEELSDVKDSKKLSKKDRSRLAKAINKNAIYSFVVEVPQVEIDGGNPYWLRYRYPELIQKVVGMPYKCGVLYDGNQVMYLPGYVSECLVKGDSKSLAIAAASILAKNAKDREMERLDQEFPEYGFINHSGYLTKDHMSAIEKYGLTECHRRKYCKKFI